MKIKISIAVIFINIILNSCVPIYTKNIPEQLAYRDYIIATVRQCLELCNSSATSKNAAVSFTILKNGHISQFGADTNKQSNDFTPVIINCFQKIESFNALPNSFADSCEFNFEFNNPCWNTTDLNSF